MAAFSTISTISLDGSCDVDDDEDDDFDDDDDDGVDDDDDDADDDEDEDGFVVAFLFDFSPPTFLFSAAVLFVLLLPVAVEFIDLSGPIDESILVVTNSSFS